MTQTVKQEKQTTVYNFEVKDVHTYYVSGLHLLVHNMCGNKDATKTPIYSAHVLKRMDEDKVFHGFQASFEKSILGKTPFKRANGREEYLQRGYIGTADKQGNFTIKSGVYHITLDNGGRVMRHRAFIPENDWARYSKRWNLPSINDIQW